LAVGTTDSAAQIAAVTTLVRIVDYLFFRRGNAAFRNPDANSEG
jgi:hypothetical protein